MKRINTFIAVLAFLPLLVNAQPLKRAQKAMDKYDYTEAVSILKKAVEKDKYINAAVPMLAECYRLQNDIFNTRTWYARAVALPEVKPQSFLYYGRTLQATGEYAMAREMFRKYAGLSSDGKGDLFTIHCDSVLGPWKGIKPGYDVKTVNNINTDQSDFGPAFYNGSLVFASDFIRNTSIVKKEYGWTGRGYLDIMKSSPSSAGDFWGNMNVPSEFDSKFNQIYHDGPACFSSDGKSIFFTRAYKDKGKKEKGFRTNLLKIFYSTKVGNDWGEIKEFYLNSPDYSVGHPAISPDGQTLYFASDMPGGEGGTDIWMCKKSGDDWGSATNLGKTINTTEEEMFPYVKEDGTLYFASSGHPGYGALDIFKSEKNKDGKWTTPLNLQPPINGSFDDFAIAWAPGKNNGFFSSNRTGGQGNDDIYSFKVAETPKEIAKPVEKPAYITGVVRDAVNLQPLEGATVFLFNKNTGNILVLKTGPDGMYKSLVEKPTDFLVKAMKPSYIADCTPFPVLEINPGTTLDAPRDLLLDKLELNREFKIDNIYYDFDKYNIRADAKPELDKLVQIMLENPINVELGSHTDSRGSFAYNDRLSENRAKSAVEYIVSQGIERSRITAKGYGEHQLTNNCSDGVKCTAAEHQANRRTMFKVTSYMTTTEIEDKFNPNEFKDGEIISESILPDGFFSKCPAQKIKIEPAKQYLAAEKTTTNNEPEVGVPPAKTVKYADSYSGNAVTYTVQFATGSVSAAKANSISGMMVQQGNDGITRYYVGQFNSPQAAKSLKNEMIKMGFKDTWIAKVDENRPMK